MFPSGNPPMKSYYKGNSTNTIQTSDPAKITSKPTTIIKFIQKDYYGNNQPENSINPDPKSSLPVPSTSILSHWWSWTFAISICPTFLFGCPFHNLLLHTTETFASNIRPPMNTQEWLKRIFSGNKVISSIISLLLLFPTGFINVYTAYQFGFSVNSLFIKAEHDPYLWDSLKRLFYNLLIMLPVDYVWLYGYKIRNMIQHWNKLVLKYKGVGCLCFNFRSRVGIVIILISGIYVIRYFTRMRYELDNPEYSATEKIEIAMETLVSIGLSLMVVVYLTFCYAVKFHLMIIKALIYQWIKDKVTPTTEHLNMVKIMYSQVSDYIFQINKWFFMYMSAVIVGVIGETLNGPKAAFAKLIIKPLFSVAALLAVIANLDKKREKPLDETEAPKPDAKLVREWNLEVLGVVLMLGLLIWTIWQAIKVNDCAREINVWLNDFSTGGSGVDLDSILHELGIHEKKTDSRVLVVEGEGDDGVARNREDDETDDMVIWARTRMDDEMLEKIRMLKAYIHVKMELEDAALLNICIVGLLRPSLGERMTRYRVMF